MKKYRNSWSSTASLVLSETNSKGKNRNQTSNGDVESFCKSQQLTMH